MQLTKKSILAALLLSLSLTGFQCTRGIPADVAQANQPVTITWWRVFDTEDSVRPTIEAYRAIHPNVTIQFRKLRFEEYEQALLEALAEDKGPDIISLHNTWIKGYQSKLSPLPLSLTLPYSAITGTLKKEVTVSLKTKASITPARVRRDFVDVVGQDVVLSLPTQSGGAQEYIYGLPLALDTMALYVNRDLLNIAGIPEIPTTWTEFQTAVKKLTKLDAKGALIQSGAALGSARNVERASDLLSLLMMQNRAEMIDISGAAAFDKTPAALEGQVPPGEQALEFYTDFANPLKETYTWSQQESGSLEAFLSGKTAMYFGYAYSLPLIRARAPRMNLVISPMPQIEGNQNIPVNFANYWVEAVSKKSAHKDWAWDFIQFATSPAQVPQYLVAAKKPTALRSLITSQSQDETMGVFVNQVLTATSWYRGRNARAAEAALLDAIEQTLEGGKIRDILKIAVQRVNQTL